MNPKVDAVFEGQGKWKAEFRKLRSLILSCGLTEELKWGQPCYTLDGKNVVLIHGFKDYCAVLFHKGVLLKDPKRILIQQTKNVQAARQVRFTTLRDVTRVEGALKAYVREATALERSGAKVPLKKTEEYDVPAELKASLDHSAPLKTAFAALTPGRQRGYMLHVSSAKRAQTREARVAHCTPRILAGLGLDD